MASRQADALQNLTGSFSLRTLSDQTPVTAQGPVGAFSIGVSAGPADARTNGQLGAGQAAATLIQFSASSSPNARTASESRPANTAYYPRIHA